MKTIAALLIICQAAFSQAIVNPYPPATHLIPGSSGGGASVAYSTVAFSATPIFTCNGTGVQGFSITLTGDVTSSTLSGCATGQVVAFRIIQDASGLHAFAPPTNSVGFATISATLNSTASTAINQAFVYDGTNLTNATVAYMTGGAAGGSISLPGSTSGVTVVQPTAAASGVLTLPAATDTLVGRATTDTLTNKTLTAPIFGVPRFNGTNSTGAGSAALGANSPATTLTAPYTWITVTTSDGSTAFIPVWK